MSLINDALKRANETASQRPGPADGVRLRPVDKPPRRNRLPLVFILLAVVLLMAIGAWFLWQGWSAGKKEELARVEQPPAQAPVPAAPSVPPPTTTTVARVNPPIAPPVAPVAPKTLPPTVQKPEVAPPIVPTNTVAPAGETPKALEPPSTNLVLTPGPVVPIYPPAGLTATPSNLDLTVATPKLKLGRSADFPELKLQGIYYRLNNPSALINGQTVRMGDVIRGVKVLVIERASVTVEFNNQKRVITFHGEE